MSMRTRDIETGEVVNGVKQVIRLHDDGYRIYFSWISGAPSYGPNWPDSGTTEPALWAEYKFCESNFASYLIADILMRGVVAPQKVVLLPGAPL